jgi:hypothetical protein
MEEFFEVEKGKLEKFWLLGVKEAFEIAGSLMKCFSVEEIDKELRLNWNFNWCVWSKSTRFEG